MNWRIKWLIAKTLSSVPMGNSLHWLMQKHLTRTWPRRIDGFAPNDPFILHAMHFRQFGGDLAGKTMFEFGAGWDLCGNLTAWCCGVDHQIVVDIDPLLKPELVDGMIDKLARIDHPAMVRWPAVKLGSDPLKTLREVYGIDYRAPCDATATGLPDASIDLVASTATLEHVPPLVIERIYRELRRICKPDAVLSLDIDYQDHYGLVDPAIGPYHFLRYDERTWDGFNCHILHQNRLRHHEHLAMLEAAGFTLAKCEGIKPADWEAWLDRTPLDPCFAGMSREQLAPVTGTIVAINRPTAAPLAAKSVDERSIAA